MVKFASNVSGAILLLSSIQVTESISGSVVPGNVYEAVQLSVVPTLLYRSVGLIKNLKK